MQLFKKSRYCLTGHFAAKVPFYTTQFLCGSLVPVFIKKWLVKSGSDTLYKDK
jgi:hypothetical protein